MNLRSKKPIPRRGRKESNLLLVSVIYAVVIASAFFSVFSYTIYLDGKSQQINKDITMKDENIYRLQREIQNLKIKMENYSRKDYIISKIKNYNLSLRTPEDYQVVNLSNNTFSRTIPEGREVAFN